MIFTVELTPDPDQGAQQVHLYLDQDGHDDLMRELARLKPGEHSHFFTEDWGGAPLTSTRQRSGSILINMLTINRVE
jgi:hypothetical protein